MHMESLQPNSVVRFGTFEVSLQSGEVQKSGFENQCAAESEANRRSALLSASSRAGLSSALLCSTQSGVTSHPSAAVKQRFRTNLRRDLLGALQSDSAAFLNLTLASGTRGTGLRALAGVRGRHIDDLAYAWHMPQEVVYECGASRESV